MLNYSFSLNFILSNILNNILLQVEKIVETSPLEAILKYGGTASVVTVLMVGIWLIIRHFLDVRKDAKDNETVLENRIVELELHKTQIQREHIATLEKHNDKLIIIIKENNAHHEKMLKDYIAEAEKQRLANGAEYDKQRAMYENMYTKLESKKS